MTFNRDEMLERFIKKITSSAGTQPQKMKRNLQPEIEKLKSIDQSIRGMYINNSEKNRLLDEIDRLKSTVECI